MPVAVLPSCSERSAVPAALAALDGPTVVAVSSCFSSCSTAAEHCVGALFAPSLKASPAVVGPTERPQGRYLSKIAIPAAVSKRSPASAAPAPAPALAPHMSADVGESPAAASTLAVEIAAAAASTKHALEVVTAATEEAGARAGTLEGAAAAAAAVSAAAQNAAHKAIETPRSVAGVAAEGSTSGRASGTVALGTCVPGAPASRPVKPVQVIPAPASSAMMVTNMMMSGKWFNFGKTVEIPHVGRRSKKKKELAASARAGSVVSVAAPTTTAETSTMASATPTTSNTNKRLTEIDAPPTTSSGVTASRRSGVVAGTVNAVGKPLSADRGSSVNDGKGGTDGTKGKESANGGLSPPGVVSACNSSIALVAVATAVTSGANVHFARQPEAAASHEFSTENSQTQKREACSEDAMLAPRPAVGQDPAPTSPGAANCFLSAMVDALVVPRVELQQPALVVSADAPAAAALAAKAGPLDSRLPAVAPMAICKAAAADAVPVSKTQPIVTPVTTAKTRMAKAELLDTTQPVVAPVATVEVAAAAAGEVPVDPTQPLVAPMATDNAAAGEVPLDTPQPVVAPVVTVEAPVDEVPVDPAQPAVAPVAIGEPAAANAVPLDTTKPAVSPLSTVEAALTADGEPVDPPQPMVAPVAIAEPPAAAAAGNKGSSFVKDLLEERETVTRRMLWVRAVVRESRKAALAATSAPQVRRSTRARHKADLARAAKAARKEEGKKVEKGFTPVAEQTRRPVLAAMYRQSKRVRAARMFVRAEAFRWKRWLSAQEEKEVRVFPIENTMGRGWDGESENFGITRNLGWEGIASTWSSLSK